MPLFNVTWERVNDREATAGGTNRYGFVEQDVSLHDALRACRQQRVAASEATGSYASDSTPSATRWYSTEIREWETGDTLTVSIHFPANATPASRARLCQLLEKLL